ncbi:MAG: hypothetical protein V1737_03285 [Chloroflexota bacterium]
MRLSKTNRLALAREIRTAVDFMGKADKARDKMYFFTAVYGVAQRIMNLEFDPELGFVHNVTNAAYNTINTALLMAAQGQSAPTLPANVFDELQKALKDLATHIEEEKQTYTVLERISNLAYSTSGNGYYLFLKGLLKV